MFLAVPVFVCDSVLPLVEQKDHVFVPVPLGQLDCRFPIPVRSSRVCSVLQEQVHNEDVSPSGCLLQRRLAFAGGREAGRALL
jgi:hypothetical protein